MKISYLNFVARANIKGNKKNKIIVIAIVFFVLSLTIVSSLSASVLHAVNEYKGDYFARSFMITPFGNKLSQNLVNQITNTEHVEGVFIQDGMRDCVFDIKDVSDETELKSRIKKGDSASITALSLIGDSKMNVIFGNSLDESPTFSCIIPDRFYPFQLPEGVEEFTGSIDYLNGESLIGKTLRLSVNPYELVITQDIDLGHELIELSELNINLKIVGVYRETGYSNGYPDTVFVSNETGKLIEKQAIENYHGKKQKIVKAWLNSPEMHDYYIVVDKYENIDFVRKQLLNLDVDCNPTQELGINPSVLTVSDFLSVVSIVLLLVTVAIAVIIIAYITFASLFNRKSEIGLMKAIGYKNKDIFGLLYIEQLLRTLYGFFIGAVISGITILIINYINGHGSYTGRVFMVSPNQFFLFVGLAFLFSILVPLICQVISLSWLFRIQPREAMSQR